MTLVTAFSICVGCKYFCFTINAQQTGYLSLNDASVTFKETGVTNFYNGEPFYPELNVSYEGKTLAEGIDYTVSYTNNVNPSFNPYCYDCYGGAYDTKNRGKYAKITVTGKYPYKDTVERYFLISGFYELTVSRLTTDFYYDYTGQEICPKPTIALYDENITTFEDLVPLTENVDYTLSYYDNVEPGKSTILITGIGKYAGFGSYHIHFYINQKNISACEVLLSADGVNYRETLPEDTYTADGTPKTPSVHLTWVIQKDGSYEPLDPSCYDVAYENNVDPGTATVRITGKNAHTGSITRTFTIGKKPETPEENDGLNSFTYSFGNTRNDFGYSSDYTIDEESIFTRLWGNTALAKDYYNYWTDNFKTWCGNCYGMSATSIMFNDDRDDIEVPGFNTAASLVKELELNDYNRTTNIRMSLLDLIESMQVSQIDETVSYIIGRSNKGKINRMCDALKDAQENNTAIIIVLDSNGPQGSHAVVGYRMEDVSSTERRIYVYDCNHPITPKYITLTMENGVCTGWHYDGGNKVQSLTWSSTENNGVTCTISYISYDSFIKVWLNRTLEQKPVSTKNVLTMNAVNAAICDKNGKELAVLKDGELQSENDEIFQYYPVCASLDGIYDKSGIQPMIYLPTDEYIVKNMDKNVSEMKLTMCNVDRMITVSTSASSVSIHVNDASKANIIQVDGEDETVQAGFYSTDSSESYKTLNYIGQCIGSSMTLGITAGEKIIENFHIVDEDTQENGNKNPNDKVPDDKPNQNPSTSTPIPFRIISSTGSNKIAAGKKVRLNLVTEGQTLGLSGITFSSSNPKVATVNNRGIVSTKKKAGGKSVVITAVDRNGQKASIKLKLMKGAVKKIRIIGKKSCKAGQALKLETKVTAGKGANKSILWKSSNARYAEVTKRGVVKTKKAGKGKKVKITATATDGSHKKASIKIKLK